MGQADSKRRSEDRVSSTASATTSTNEASSESNGGSNSPGDGKDGPAFKSYERLFYNGNSDSISKVPPENAAAINKDTPESWPIKKITTAEALSQETEELEDSLDFGNQVIEHI
ncbi:hypothetical protein YC2023_070439 [Brassica napus]